MASCKRKEYQNRDNALFIFELGYGCKIIKNKHKWLKKYILGCHLSINRPEAVLGIFIWVGQSKVKQILGRPTGVVYVGIMGMTRAFWVGQERVWLGHGLPGLIARTASEIGQIFLLSN